MSTIRVLALDGGGERGYLQAIVLNLFIQQWGINPNELWKHFDVICGASVGGIQALAYAKGMSPNEVIPFFTNAGPWIFTIRTAADVLAGSNNASLPSNRPNLAQKIALMGTNDPFYNSVSPTLSNYGSTRLYSEMASTFTDMTLQDLKTKVLIPAYDKTSQRFSLFSNAGMAGYTGQNELVKNVAAATSAAPIYLPSFPFSYEGGNTYLDGGIFQNNPASFGLTLGQQLKPSANRFCVLSIGTGLGSIGFSPLDSVKRNSHHLKNSLSPNDNAFASLFATIDQSITGCQESVAQELLLRSSQYTLNKLYYYRFQYELDKENYDTDMDNTDPAFLTYLAESATARYNEDIENISTFIGHLES